MLHDKLSFSFVFFFFLFSATTINNYNVIDAATEILCSNLCIICQERRAHTSQLIYKRCEKTFLHSCLLTDEVYCVYMKYVVYNNVYVMCMCL